MVHSEVTVFGTPAITYQYVNQWFYQQLEELFS